MLHDAPTLNRVAVRRRAWALRFIPLAAAVLVGVLSGAAETQVRVADLHDRLVDPFRVPPHTQAIVFLFVATDCPISNRYAPRVRQLFDAFASRGVLFWLVYPNPGDSPDAIRAHLAAYAYPERALRDPEHTLVKHSGVVVTPEAAVYDTRGQLLYRGRIDNRYVRLGVERPSATRQDLEDAITAALAGGLMPASRTQAVGCFIADAIAR